MPDEQLELPLHITLKNDLPLTLRLGMPEDAEQLVAYFEQVAGETDFLGFGSSDFGVSVEEEREFLRQYAKDPNSLYLIADVAGEIAGALSFTPGKRLRFKHAGVFGISILRKYWGSGLGSRLLGYLIAWARQNGTIRKINLVVRADNLSAIRLYEKYGFVKEGHIAREIYVRGEFFDSYAMGLKIDPQ
ncbi:GNAT family N-acetyltransferase [Ktedonosporobacter rubrisoli]|uniref:GNAT family N-acetyltransferase n=1 Tax=Ktedonosporobacter rubrisoli TaxID=2509675 RepID=A0A4P6JVG0_KTERU|nr:GNAT family N-acetyltransferase [Ktedonosporobacter rubrisoli]QBD79647.1 GNAT family N-acetyltransferase [Ktedonosporobacter rubrisoli]